MRRALENLGKILAAVALFVGISSVNSASTIIFNQPEVPESMNKYRK